MNGLPVFNPRKPDNEKSRQGEIVPLNALKLLCAFMVAGIHIPFVGDAYLDPIYRIAVPIFFLISGYFLIDGSGQLGTVRICRALKKSILLTIYANIVYYIFNAVIFKIYRYSFWKTLVEGGTISTVLWYMTAYIQALAVVWIFVKLKLSNFLPLLVPIGIFLNLFFGTYYWLTFDDIPTVCFDGGEPNSLFLSRNFLTVALPCMVLGMWIRVRRLSFSTVKLCIATILLAMAVYWEKDMVMSVGEAGLYGDIVFMTIPLSVSVFLLALNMDGKSQVIRLMGYLGKRHSVNVYLYHCMMYLILGVMMYHSSVDIPHEYYWKLPVILILIVTFSALYDTIKKTINKRLSGNVIADGAGFA